MNFEDTCKGFLEVAKVRQRFVFSPVINPNVFFASALSGLVVAQMAVEMKN